jgi:hypothetical protein
MRFEAVIGEHKTAAAALDDTFEGHSELPPLHISTGGKSGENIRSLQNTLKYMTEVRKVAYIKGLSLRSRRTLSAGLQEIMSTSCEKRA